LNNWAKGIQQLKAQREGKERKGKERKGKERKERKKGRNHL